MMRPILIFLFVLITTRDLGSQIRVGLYSGLSIYPSTGTDRFLIGKNGSSFDRFIQNYNNLNKADLSSPLTPFKMKPSLHFGINGVFNGFYSEIAFNSIHGISQSTFTNGNKRFIEMKSRDLDIGMGFGITRSKWYAHIVGIMFFSFGDQLDAWTEYKDGTKSFGNENYLNGHYEAMRLGVRPGFRFGYSINQKFMVMFSLDKLKEGNNNDPYRDELAGDLSTELIVTDPEYIGVDWADYLNNSVDYVLNEKEFVKSGWSGIQTRIGICYNLYYYE